MSDVFFSQDEQNEKFVPSLYYPCGPSAAEDISNVSIDRIDYYAPYEFDNAGIGKIFFISFNVKSTDSLTPKE